MRLCWKWCRWHWYYVVSRLVVFIHLHFPLSNILPFQLLSLRQESQCQCPRCGWGSLPKNSKKKKKNSKTLQYHKSSRLWLHAIHCPEHSVTRLKIQWKCLSLNTGAIFIYQCDRSERERELAGHFACGEFPPIRVHQRQPCCGLVCVGLLGLFTVMCSGLPTGQKKLNQHWNQ